MIRVYNKGVYMDYNNLTWLVRSPTSEQNRELLKDVEKGEEGNVVYVNFEDKRRIE